MPTTSNFGWTTPADTDLVKDGAAAIRTLGNGIDTSLLDLKGGTSGQVLSKNSNTDLDYTWVTPNVGDITEVQAGVGISVASGTGPIPIITNSSTDLITTAGDLLYGTAADTVARLGIGTAGQVLKVNSGATAPEWGVAASGALTLISRQAFSNVASISFSDVFTTTYEGYLFVFTNVSAATVGDNFQFNLIKSGGTDETAGYYGTSVSHSFNAQTFTWLQSSNAAIFDAFLESDRIVGQMFVSGNGAGASGRLGWVGQLGSVNSGYGAQIDGWGNNNQTYTGIKFKSSSTNITGTISLYGLAKA